MPKNNISKSEQRFNHFKKWILDLFCLDEDGICKMTGIQNGQSISNLKYPKGTRSTVSWLKYIRENTKDFAYNTSRVSCAHSGYFDFSASLHPSVRPLAIISSSRKSRYPLIEELSKWIFDLCSMYMGESSHQKYTYDRLLLIRDRLGRRVVSITDIALTNLFIDAHVSTRYPNPGLAKNVSDYVKVHREWYDNFRKVVDLRLLAAEDDFVEHIPQAMRVSAEYKHTMRYLDMYSNIHAFYPGPGVDLHTCYTPEIFTQRAFSDVLMSYASTAEILLTTEHILSDVPAMKTIVDVILIEVADYISRKNGLEGADLIYHMHPVHVFNCIAQLRDVIADTRKISITAMMNRRTEKYGSLV